MFRWKVQLSFVNLGNVTYCTVDHVQWWCLLWTHVTTVHRGGCAHGDYMLKLSTGMISTANVRRTLLDRFTLGVAVRLLAKMRSPCRHCSLWHPPKTINTIDVDELFYFSCLCPCCKYDTRMSPHYRKTCHLPFRAGTFFFFANSSYRLGVRCPTRLELIPHLDSIAACSIF